MQKKTQQTINIFLTYSKTPIFFALKLKIGFLHTRATAPKFLLKYVLWHKSLKYFKKSCVIGE